MNMTEEQISHMVARFLGWRLPENFNPDAGISFKVEFNEGYMASQGKPPMKHVPTGTNLFDSRQAAEMVRYMLKGLPAAEPDTYEYAGFRYEVKRYNGRAVAMHPQEGQHPAAAKDKHRRAALESFFQDGKQ